ncbi:hypothetical protein QAD02_001536 [Eretmocerus hayati]|uniref:Uncharacterized protein n=1 Tax=Eretmocerus hayati TaxID=131215 RepID=A0ACC2NGR5_9HYME|nr:hypothetical protein QAD02_001536 [Eretmocerus hayati]
MNTLSSRGRSRHSDGASSVAHVQDSQRRAPRSNGASYAVMRADQHDDSGEPAVPSHETSMRQLREANEAQNRQIAAQAQEIAILRAQLEVTQAQIRHVLEARRDGLSIDRMPTPHGHVDAHSMNPLQPIPLMQNATTHIGSNSTGSSHILDQTAGSMSGSHTSATTSPASAHAHVIPEPEVSVGSSLVGTAQVPELVSLLLQACQDFEGYFLQRSPNNVSHRTASRLRWQMLIFAKHQESDEFII